LQQFSAQAHLPSTRHPAFPQAQDDDFKQHAFPAASDCPQATKANMTTAKIKRQFFIIISFYNVNG